MWTQNRLRRIVCAVAAGGVLLLMWLGWLPSNDGSRRSVVESAAALADGLEPALVPTLGQWGLLLLALAMMGVAFLVMRRNSARDRREP